MAAIRGLPGRPPGRYHARGRERYHNAANDVVRVVGGPAGPRGRCWHRGDRRGRVRRRAVRQDGHGGTGAGGQRRQPAGERRGTARGAERPRLGQRHHPRLADRARLADRRQVRRGRLPRRHRAVPRHPRRSAIQRRSRRDRRAQPADSARRARGRNAAAGHEVPAFRLARRHQDQQGVGHPALPVGSRAGAGDRRDRPGGRDWPIPQAPAAGQARDRRRDPARRRQRDDHGAARHLVARRGRRERGSGRLQPSGS